MKAVLRWAVSNIPMMVLALILAALAWIVAVEEGDRTLEERYSPAIPVTLSELPEGMVIVGEFDARVQITVRAPESVWRSLRFDDFTVTADLTGLDAGEHRVPVQVTLSKSPAQVLLFEPEYVTLALEPEAERIVPVRVHIEGEPALGYLRRAETVIPYQVTVSGPSTYVTQVVEAFTQVSVQDASADIEEDFPLQLLDDDGQPVPHVTLTSAMVHVHIPIELSEEYHTLTVRPRRDGLLAFGYSITGFSVEPDTVTVSGAPDVLAGLPGFIETETIDVEGAQVDVIVHPALNVPENIVLVSGQQVTVTFFVEAIQSSLIMEITPTLQGLEPGLAATVSPETVEVFLSGPLSQLNTLKTDDVRVILDLFDLEPETHPIEPQIVVPEGVTAQSINPATVQVEIFIAPTSAPTGEAIEVEQDQ